MPGLPDSVMWNAYTVPGNELVRLTFDASGFLALYILLDGFKHNSMWRAAALAGKVLDAPFQVVVNFERCSHGESFITW